jgi:hypothetical protein
MVVGTASVGAAPAERCFSATGYCISGEIRRFWEQNGGVAIFGYPITPQQNEMVEGQQRQVQWFQRNRMELHPEYRWPDSVQLGRVGADQLVRLGRDWSPPVDAAAQPGCTFFAATGRNLCGDFLRAWSAGGLERDGRRGLSPAENTALFGLPLTDQQQETLSDGQTYLVQWFERARMELHPELPARQRVLMGLLGVEAGPVVSAPPALNLSEPVRIVIPAIGLDQQILGVGVDSHGEPIVPKHNVGWFNQSAEPGQGENIVLWGHVLRFYEAPDIPAPFAKIKNLQPGDTITLYTRGGDLFRYTVRRQVWVNPSEVRYILPQGHERLTLVSCIGDQVIQNGEVTDMSHRLITIAE